MVVSDGEKRNIELALREARREKRRMTLKGFAHMVIPTHKGIAESQKSKKVSFSRGSIPSIDYRERTQAKVVRAQFGKLSNDRQPASSKILNGGSEFFRRDDGYDGPRYLR